MENISVEMKSNLCRVCLGLGEYEINNGVIIVDDQSIQLNEILKEFTCLDLENLDVDASNIPTLICSICSDKLIQCYQFLQQIQKADDYIMKLLTMPPITNEDHNFEIDKTESENEQAEVEEFIVHIVDEFGNEIIVKDPPTKINDADTPKKTNIQRKRNINKRKKSNLILTENVSTVLSHIENGPENCEGNNDDENDNENINVNKKFKITNLHNSLEDVAFVITKFIPSESTHTTENVETNSSNQTSTFNQSNNDDIIKSQNLIRTYDLAAVEIDPTDKTQFNKLIERNYDDDDENDDDDEGNSDSNNGAVYACQYCPRAFSSSQFLKQHIRKTHVCQFCMKGFEKSSQLFEHIRNNHSQFNCPFCQKSYKSNSNLRQHMKKIHTFKLPAHTSLLAFSKKDENVSSNQNDGVIIE